MLPVCLSGPAMLHTTHSPALVHLTTCSCSCILSTALLAVFPRRRAAPDVLLVRPHTHSHAAGESPCLALLEVDEDPQRSTLEVIAGVATSFTSGVWDLAARARAQASAVGPRALRDGEQGGRRRVARGRRGRARGGGRPAACGLARCCGRGCRRGARSDAPAAACVQGYRMGTGAWCPHPVALAWVSGCGGSGCSLVVRLCGHPGQLTTRGWAVSS